MIRLLAAALPAVAQEVRTEMVEAAAATARVVLSCKGCGNNSAEYTVTGAAGQILSVDLLSDNGALNFSISARGAAEAMFMAETSGLVADVSLPAAGDQVVQVST